MSAESAREHQAEFDAVEGHIKRGELVAALHILEQMLARPLAALERVMIWVDIAIVNEEMLRFDDALRAYDEAIALERSIPGYWSLWEKAAFLAKYGRNRESLALFEELRIRSDLKEDDRAKVEQNIESLREAVRSR